VFVVLEGTVRFIVGDADMVASSRQVVIGPPNVAHRFEIEGDGPARLVNIHPTGVFQTDWIPPV
jgi:quercetin dioxygenase-like cupin family protein